jgi:hypothetical protein
MAPPGFQEDVGYHLCISEEFYIQEEGFKKGKVGVAPAAERMIQAKNN